MLVTKVHGDRSRALLRARLPLLLARWLPLRAGRWGWSAIKTFALWRSAKLGPRLRVSQGRAQAFCNLCSLGKRCRIRESNETLCLQVEASNKPIQSLRILYV